MLTKKNNNSLFYIIISIILETINFSYQLSKSICKIGKLMLWMFHIFVVEIISRASKQST